MGFRYEAAARLARMKYRRWLVVGAAVVILAGAPVLIARLPAAESGIDASSLLRRIEGSAEISYVGVAESNAGFMFPDFERAQRLIELFGETTTMRVWFLDSMHWRVDEIGPIDERDIYSDEHGLWLWNSGRESATRVEGHAPVRFVRASDLTPAELGRRLAAAAVPGEASRIPARRVAGIHTAGLRIQPQSPDTTVGVVDIWADPATGLPVAVEITPRGTDTPIISAEFLDIELVAPQPDVVTFVPPENAEINVSEAPDFAQAVNRYSPFLTPPTLGDLSRRTSVARGAATYGDGFDLVAALVLGARFTPFHHDELEQVPEVTGTFGTGRFMMTPLLNGLYIERNGIAYLIGGSVRREALLEAASRLVSAIERTPLQ